MRFERGNAAAMRDALVAIKDINDKRHHDADGYKINDIINDALAAPPRNCDVGTVEEQTHRMLLYCKSHGEDESGCFRCDKCPFLTVERCELAWAQMPYDVYEKGKCDEQK